MKRPTLRMARRKDGGGVELRVTHAREMRRWGMGEDMRCTAEQWDSGGRRFTKRMRDHVAQNAVLDKVLAVARRIVDELIMEERWSWAEFDQRFRGGGEAPQLPAYLDRMAAEMDGQDRAGNAAIYRYTANVLRTHLKPKVLGFDTLTGDVLYTLDASMRAGGAQDGGIGAVMRTIRAGVNRAMKEGLVKQERYPFATSRTVGYEMKMLKKKKVSRALGDTEMALFKRFPYERYPLLAYWVRMFLIIYYARGMNLVDLAHLREEQIHGERIRYRRQKTIRRVEKVLSVPLRGELKVLMDLVPPGKDGYVFPILTKLHRTARQKKDRIDKCRKQMNEAVKKAAAILGIKGDITTYVARHTYAMKLKNEGVDARKISEAMGHASMATTEPYLAQFEDRDLDATDEVL